MLELTRPALSMDLETTGLKIGTDRIVQISLVHIAPGTLEMKPWQSLINPGVPIPRRLTEECHHISDEMVASAPPLEQLAPKIQRVVQGCDWMGFNCRSFDLPFLAFEMNRVGYPIDIDKANVVDWKVIYHMLRQRRLVDFVKDYCNVDITEEAHDAQVDAMWTFKAGLACLAAHPNLPRTVEGLEQYAFPRDPNSADRDGKFKWEGDNLVVQFGKWQGKNVLAVQRGYFTWMCGEGANFDVDTKRVAALLAEGKLPLRENQ